MLISICLVIGASALILHAFTHLFFEQKVTSDIEKGQIFSIDLIIDLNSATLMLGDTFAVNPVITNISTEEMYVFMEIVFPMTWNELPLYSFTAENGWTCVENGGET